MLLALKISEETYDVYTAHKSHIHHPLEIVNNAYLVKETETDEWMWVPPRLFHDFYEFKSPELPLEFVEIVKKKED
jgi:hypothetical protein